MIVVKYLDVKQWKNLSTAIEWVKGIDNTKNFISIKSDIRKFYPSISESILKKSILFAVEYYHIRRYLNNRPLPKMFIIQ